MTKEKAKANDANASLSYAVHSIAQESRSNQTQQDMNRIYSTVFLQQQNNHFPAGKQTRRNDGKKTNNSFHVQQLYVFILLIS